MRGGNKSDETLDAKLRPSSEVVYGDADFMKNAYGDHSFCGPHFYLNLEQVSPLLTHPAIFYNVSYLKWAPGGTLILTTVEETRKQAGTVGCRH